MHFIFAQARFDAGELITQREKVSRSVSEALTERSAQFGLILDDISIVSNLDFTLILYNIHSLLDKSLMWYSLFTFKVYEFKGNC